MRLLIIRFFIPLVLFFPALASADFPKVASTYHTVAVKSDGTVVTWGDNTYGQLGDGTATNSLSSVELPRLKDLVVAAGSLSFCSSQVRRYGDDMGK